MSETMPIEQYLEEGGVLSSPDNAPPRYRGELLRLMASFVDSELAGSAGFADTINDAPGIQERISAARIVLEKADHAGLVLKIMETFGADGGRYAVHHTWSARLARGADIGAVRQGGDMRLSVFHYPIEGWIDVTSVATAFICGPEPMMLAIAAALREHGLRDEQIKFELFASSQPGRASRKVESVASADHAATCKATVTLDGATRTFNFPKHGQCLLDAALENAMDVPYACKAGVCSTCRAKVLEGEVEMEVNHALEDYEVRQGYVLTCQCHPLTDRIVVSYDQ